MLEKAGYSLGIGGGLAVLAFIPLLVWQYRRYGAFQPARMAWLASGFVYLTALIAYTLFPLPDMSGDFCATHSVGVVLDPTEYFRMMARNLAGLSLREALLSWDVLQMVFNVALFVPLGIWFSDFLVIRAWKGIPLGFCCSLFIEATQYTGNWGLMACRYRVADVNDLITNTTGTIVGYLIALLIPRFVARPVYLRKRRNMARPITRGRRWTSMLLDVVAWLMAWGVLYAGFTIGYLMLIGMTASLADRQAAVAQAFASCATAAGLLVAIPPALSPSGASLGQRIVFLRPVARHRWQLLARALAVQGAGAIAMSAPTAVAIPLMMWVVAAVCSVIWTPRGLSCVISGCTMTDARSLPASRTRAVADSPA